ncbi:sodium- and chloride-dependent glycine transporter 1-like isoform X2 [Mya arenaria]|uniref:sodium- and chloride-dependent glycine transporter 1-like isoform X2 n=1 Tax=Mya arenaria TaxID=6604 RepID=UPI0022E6C457|nr:sodium- and chloride-dependent glycine transporter 1-like isoform X2 [Mya arenaria]
MERESLKEKRDNGYCRDSSKNGEDILNSNLKEARGNWGSRIEFLLALIGYTVGVGSIWRFPILCARNGGGAFLIPFFIFMATCGYPLYYLEVSLGQFYGNSAGLAFELCPLLKEQLSVATAAVSSMTVTNQSSISFQINETLGATLNATTKNISPATEFWLHNVLRASSGLEDMGTIQWHLVISNFVGWAIVVASLVKGVHSLGKVVYVTATAPYLLLTVLFIRGLLLDGAIDGIIWYITPDFNKLADPQVWLEAAIQVFYSLGPTYGGVITMASHNKFHQKSIVETIICVASDAFTAFYAGLVVFTCMGFIAKEAGVSVEEAAKASGPGLAFIAYPEAIARMPLPQLWAVLFFLMLITVAFDSTFGMFETVTGTILDIFPHQLMNRKVPVLIGTALVLFLLSIPLAMSGGIYLFQLGDWYISAFALLFGSALEGMIICWIYGADRFSKDIELMTGRKSSKILRIFWCIIMTGFLTLAFIVTLFTYSEPYYGNYKFKPYAIIIGLCMSIVPFIPVIGVAMIEVYQADGPIPKRLSKLLKPSPKWGPIDENAREMYTAKPYRYEDTLFKRIKMNILGDKGTPWI